MDHPTLDHLAEQRGTITTALTLTSDLAEVGRARRAVRELMSRGYTDDTVDRAEHCASELVANAITHSDSRRPDGRITLVVIESSESVRIEVIDDGSSSTEPLLKMSADTDTDGRGLFLVSALATSWGSFTDEAGRTTWCEVSAK